MGKNNLSLPSMALKKVAKSCLFHKYKLLGVLRTTIVVKAKLTYRGSF